MSFSSFGRAFPFVTLAFILVFAGFAGCTGGDMATVTINVGHPGFAKTHTPSFFDRMLSFLSFGARAEAGPAPLDFSIDLMTISVSAPDFETITRDIPLETGQLTLDVPAGNNRYFTLVAFNDHGDGYITRDYGGIVTTNLQGGSSVILTISMENLPPQVTWPGMLGAGMFGVSVDWNESAGAEGYYVYRSEIVDGPYEMIAHVPGFSNTDYFDEDVNVDGTHTYYYKVCGYNSNGIGTLSDYQWANPGP